MDTEIFLGIGGLAALLFVLLGCWSLHRRLQVRSSFSLLISVIGLLAWLPISQVVEYFVMSRIVHGQTSATLNWILVASDLILPIVLLLAAAVCFWLATRAIEPRPNSSFKPNPLRGSA